MKVIGAGLPRTGTLTQKVALEMLGFGPCYHMVNILSDLSLVPAWREVFEGGRDWDRVLAAFDSSVDWPTSFFYRELLEAYPDAKVLLSVRDPKRWEHSMRDTIWDTLTGESLMHDLSAAATRVNSGWRDYIELMSDMWEVAGTYGDDAQGQLYLTHERHVEQVKRTVPAERLLVWDAGEGWDPLCEFLEVPVPPAPLPHLNDSVQFRDRIVETTLKMLNEWFASQPAGQTAAAAPN